MSDHSGHAGHFSVRRYILVFVGLLIGTVITVGAYFLGPLIGINSVALTIAVALFIAIIKAFLVAGYFMHLMSEKKMIYGILASTAFFFVGLMFLTIWAMQDFPTLLTK